MFSTTNVRLVRLPIVIAACVILLVVARAEADVRTALEGHEVFNIWPGAAPGTGDWTGDEFSGNRSVTNVTVPTLIAFYPKRGDAIGSAMVVCPGGAFTGLAIIEEGTMVAEWLAARGITAFVLKYRVRPGLANPGSSVASGGAGFDERARALETGRRIAVADALQAMRYLRARAPQLRIDPARIGMMGFSAGAMTTMSAVLEGAAGEVPDIAASIYGAMPEGNPPPKAPPLFIVHASDDTLVPALKSVQMYSAWSGKGLPVELHVFGDGGHGFGAVTRNRATDQWLGLYERWLSGLHWIRAAAESSGPTSGKQDPS